MLVSPVHDQGRMSCPPSHLSHTELPSKTYRVNLLKIVIINLYLYIFYWHHPFLQHMLWYSLGRFLICCHTFLSFACTRHQNKDVHRKSRKGNHLQANLKGRREHFIQIILQTVRGQRERGRASADGFLPVRSWAGHDHLPWGLFFFSTRYVWSDG